MSFIGGSIHDRLTAFAAKRKLVVATRLGFGKDGTVWATAESTAVKVFERPETYLQERSVYERFATHQLDAVCGHHIPQVITSDDDLAVLEMTIVQPPFLLDFASAQLDHPQEFPEDIMQEWAASKREEFGRNWPKVVGILHALERLGIYMLDVHPGNIRFSNQPESDS